MLLAREQRAFAAERVHAHRNAKPQWHITETTNFRVMNYGLGPVNPAIGEDCERLRCQLATQWFAEVPPSWRPKCDLVLHSSDASYDREVGSAGRSTIASALVDRRQKQVVVRRIDVRATRSNWQKAALAHELTHVVLAERFKQDILPRWLDEGIAILADTDEKRNLHIAGAKKDVSRGVHFSLAELLLLDGYPPAQRWGAFYDQSASLVEFLVAEQGHQRLLDFADLAQQLGYDKAFQRIYAMSAVELERRWQKSLLTFDRTARNGASVESVSWVSTDTGG
jgi:hypothetical protein